MKIRVSVLGLILSILATTGIATANSLVQMDVRKSGSDALNMTFMTSESDAGNVIVRKKSDNKYVLLIPKVSSENYKSQILSSSVREVVSDVDVKNVDDGANGYTKVTLITTKPLEISATTKKAVAGDNKEYKNVLANAPKQAATTTPLVAKTASATPAKNIKQVAAMTKPAVSTAKPTVTKT